MPLSVRVIRMDLHGEFFLWEDKFHKQGNALKAAQARSRPLLGQFWPDLTERTSGEVAGSNAAVIPREPSFTDWFSFLRSFGK